MSIWPNQEGLIHFQRQLCSLHNLTNESWKDKQSKPGHTRDRWEKLRMSAVVMTS